MAFEELLQKIQSEDVTWDDVRERRVLNRIREELAAPVVVSPRGFRIAPAAVGAVAAVLLIGLVGFWVFDESGDSRVKGALAVSSLERAQAAQPSTMLIGDVGQVQLMEGARVAIQQQTRQTVKLQQTQGEAVYQIEHRSGREVFVYAGGVEIRVVGTVFTVALSAEMVNVHVEKGFVRINDGERLVELRSGEEISVATRSGDGASNNRAPRVDNSENKLKSVSASKNTKNHDEELAEGAVPPKRVKAASRRSTKQLFVEVDRARGAGNLGKAAQTLEVIISRKDDHSSVVSALFILGKVERARSRYVRAAKAFSKSFRLGAGGPLAEDALAETAAAWSAAKKTDKAKEAARSYLRLYPSGIHAARMTNIIN